MPRWRKLLPRRIHPAARRILMPGDGGRALRDGSGGPRLRLEDGGDVDAFPPGDDGRARSLSEDPESTEQMKLTEQMRVAPFESEQDSWEFYLDAMHCGEAMMSKMSTMISSYCCLALEAGSARGLEEFLDTIIDKQRR